LESVVRAFGQKIHWWSTDFPLRANEVADAERASAEATIASVESQEEDLTLSPFSAAATSSLSAAHPIGAPTDFKMKSDLEKIDGSVPSLSQPAFALQKWSSNPEYLERLRSIKTSDGRYSAYLETRRGHLREPGFFLDTADLFFELGDSEMALRILSNVAELGVDDPGLLRVLAYRLNEANHWDLAIPVLERVLALRPEEPQSRRDLALADAATGAFQPAVDLLWEIVSRSWDARFPEIELIALSELNSIAATCGKTLNLSRVDPRLRQNLPLDLRVILTWDATDSDIDLWVSDPYEQTAKYDFPLTHQGGRLSRDFTGGYGPEEFDLHHAKSGKYLVKINSYGDHRQNGLGPVTAQVRLITGFGTSAQKEKRVTVRLKNQQHTIEIATVEIVPPKAK
jgi:Ca-activated chloride channel homolog